MEYNDIEKKENEIIWKGKQMGYKEKRENKRNHMERKASIATKEKT